MPSFSQYLQPAVLAALAGVGTFAQETREQATLTANSSQLPLVVLGDFTTSIKAADSRVTRADISMFFGDSKPGQGDDPVAEVDTVARMAELKRRFLSALDSNALVEITNVRATPIHNTYEAELTGVGVQFTLGVPASTLTAECLGFLPAVPPLNALVTQDGRYLITEG